MNNRRAVHGLDTYDYLFVDGHVEELPRLATLHSTDSAANPQDRQSGMWTIDAKQ